MKKIKLFKFVASFALCFSLVSLFGCSSESESNEQDFQSILAEKTSDENKYQNIGYLGEWYLGTINAGEAENPEEGYIWETPDYLETLTIEASGLIRDTIDEDSIEGYIVPDEMPAELENSVKNYSPTNFKAVFIYQYDEEQSEELELNFVYDPEQDTLSIVYDGDIITAVYYRGEVEYITELEDGTYVDKDGNPVEIEEDKIVNKD